MDTRSVDLNQLPYQPLFTDYLYQKDTSALFFPWKHSYQHLCEAVEAYNYPHDRHVSAKILHQINKPFEKHPEVKRNLKLLEKEDTVTITTGQQVMVAGGPLLTIYKIASLITLAKKLTEDTSKHVIPVFWLADEDHDFDEIAKVDILENFRHKTCTLPGHTGTGRYAVSNLKPDHSGLASFFRSLFDNLSDTEFSRELQDIVTSAYNNAPSYDLAFANLIHHFFSAYGLLFAKSNTKEVKKYTKSTIEKAVIYSEDIREKLNLRTKKIAQHYKPQVSVPSSLLFYHDQEKGRLRMDVRNNIWHIDGTDKTYSNDALRTIIQDEPWRFSPNVFLRPLIQDHLLPNAAYIGGPAEIAYHAQLTSIYPLFTQNQPFIAGRLTATIIEPAAKRLMKQLPFDFLHYSERIEDLEKDYIQDMNLNDMDHSISEWKHAVSKLQESILESGFIQEPGLKKHVGAMQKDFEKSIDKLKKKIVQQQKKKEETALNRIAKIKEMLFPASLLQERSLSFIYILNKYGVDFNHRLIQHLLLSDDLLTTRHLLIDPHLDKNGQT